MKFAVYNVTVINLMQEMQYSLEFKSFLHGIHMRGASEFVTRILHGDCLAGRHQTKDLFNSIIYLIVRSHKASMARDRV